MKPSNLEKAAEEYYQNFLKTTGMFGNSRTRWMKQDFMAGAKFRDAQIAESRIECEMIT